MNEINVKEIFEFNGEIYVQNEPLPIKRSYFERFKESTLWDDWKAVLSIIATIELIIKLLPEFVIVE